MGYFEMEHMLEEFGQKKIMDLQLLKLLIMRSMI